MPAGRCVVAVRIRDPHGNHRQAGGPAVVAVVLAVHGWSGRHSGVPPGALGSGNGSGNAAAAPSRSPSARPSSHHSRAPSPSPGGAGTPAASPGPLLSSEPYASYSYLVWPGAPSPSAAAALAGLSVSVHRVSGGISVTAGVVGQATPAPRIYARGARVYIVEGSMGDDSGNSDYNLGDDAIVVTDTQQRILQ